MSEDICSHRAPGTCCPEPSCDHAWHGQLKAQGLQEHGMQCEECGATCATCLHCGQCPEYAIRVENDRAQEDGFCQELLIHVRGSDRCRRPS